MTWLHDSIKKLKISIYIRDKAKLSLNYYRNLRNIPLLNKNPITLPVNPLFFVISYTFLTYVAFKHFSRISIT